LFDIHGDTLAMPLLMFTLEALDRRDYRRVLIWGSLTAMCKDYVGLLLALHGFVLLLRRKWQDGGLMIGLGATWMAIMLMLKDLAEKTLSGASGTTTGAAEASILRQLSYHFGDLLQIFSWEQVALRGSTALLVLLPLAFLLRKGWTWALPGLALTAAALLATGPGRDYLIWYHHYALAVPFFVLAALHALKEIKQRDAHQMQRHLLLTLSMTILLKITIVPSPLNGYLFRFREASQIPKRLASRHSLLSMIPPGSPVLADPFFAPHLVNRLTLYVTCYTDRGYAMLDQARLLQADYVLLDLMSPLCNLPILEHYLQLEYQVSAQRDGFVLLRRQERQSGLDFQWQLSSSTNGPAPRQAQWEQIGLRDASWRWTNEGLLELTYSWQRKPHDPSGRPIIAVSRLFSAEENFYVHIPGLTVLGLPPGQSSVGFEETFRIMPPRCLNELSLTVSLYKLVYLIEGDERFAYLSTEPGNLIGKARIGAIPCWKGGAQ
jgi:uncharacterized membrane protein